MAAFLEVSLSKISSFNKLLMPEFSSHRRLSDDESSSTPGWVDFLVVFVLVLFFYKLLKALLAMSQKWTDKMMERVTAAIKLRNQSRDTFRKQNGHSWDYVIVLKVYKHDDKLSKMQDMYSFKKILLQLTNGGFQTKVFFSAQCDEVFIKIRASLTRLEREADRINMKMQLDPIRLAATCKEGKLVDGEWRWKPLDMPDTCDETHINPYEYIYAAYEFGRLDVKNLYKKFPNKSVLRGVDRLKLMYSILVSRPSDGGSGLDIYRLIKKKAVLAFYPLHDHVELKTLEEKWLRLCAAPWNQPMEEIKDYFGEKIALYFLWLGHYTSWLMGASVISFIAYLTVAANDNNPNSAFMPYYAIFMSFWAMLFLEFWKRKENYAAMKWGTVGFEEEEQARPQFDGQMAPSPITGVPRLYFPKKERARREIISYSVISAFVVAVVGAVAGVFILKLILVHMRELTQGGIAFGGVIASIANAVVIQVMNIIYGGVAIKLTDYENHRTDTEYEDSLIAKTFVFQFVNSYASLFYIAFVKPYIGYLDPCIGSCLVELQTNLGSIFMVRLFVGNLTEIGLPMFMAKQKEKAESAGSEVEIGETEKAFHKPEYHVMLGTFADYAEMIIQFGYATMFVLAYPLSSVLAFTNNYIEIRVDAWKLTQVSRRPEPRTAEDIGTWHTILEVMVFVAIAINAALVAFTGNFAIDVTWPNRVWIFFSMTAGVLVLNLFIGFLVPDMPEQVTIQLQRSKMIVDKVFHSVPDDDDESLSKTLRADLDIVIRLTDDDPL